MDDLELQRRFDLARALCREAGVIALAGFRAAQGVVVNSKGLHDLVTSVDLEIDAVLRSRLAQDFPADGIVTEEATATMAEVLWVIDPIDGTHNFARGIAHFAISIAFVCDGATQFGVVHNPVTDEMFTARRAYGAFLNDTPIRVSTVTIPSEATIDIGYSTKRSNADYLALLKRALDASFGFLQQGSAALGLAQVACGRLDGYVEEVLFSWDVLAGILLVEEAGGWASTFPVSADLTRGRPVLACVPALKEDLERVALTERWTKG